MSTASAPHSASEPETPREYRSRAESQQQQQPQQRLQSSAGTSAVEDERGRSRSRENKQSQEDENGLEISLMGFKTGKKHSKSPTKMRMNGVK